MHGGSPLGAFLLHLLITSPKYAIFYSCYILYNCYILGKLCPNLIDEIFFPCSLAVAIGLLFFFAPIHTSFSFMGRFYELRPLSIGDSPWVLSIYRKGLSNQLWQANQPFFNKHIKSTFSSKDKLEHVQEKYHLPFHSGRFALNPQ